MKKTVYLYVFDTMADWEASYIIAELNTGRFFKKDACKFDVKTLGLTKEPIITMGGIKILPELSIEQFTNKNLALLILPGGETWLEPIHEPILEKVSNCLKSNVVIGAICGATFALANNGFLDNCKHTSNDLNFLKSCCPMYKGEKFYEEEPVVTDNNLITASGISPIEFSTHILKKLDVFLPDTLTAWYHMYLSRNPNYFVEILESLAQK